MPGNVQATLHISNLDDKVDERLLYEIMVQAGPLVEVYIPRDKDTKRHRGYGFAEYTTEKSAAYALRLFSGLVTIHNRSIRFAMSGADKEAQISKDAAERGRSPQRDTYHRHSRYSSRERSPPDWRSSDLRERSPVWRRLGRSESYSRGKDGPGKSQEAQQPSAVQPILDWMMCFTALYVNTDLYYHRVVKAKPIIAPLHDPASFVRVNFAKMTTAL